MKGIKLRAWDKRAKRWFEPDEFRVDGNGEVYFTDHDRPERWGDWGEQFELVEYTGLKDKNGREIYEGNVIVCHDASMFRQSETMAVDFEAGAFGMYSPSNRTRYLMHNFHRLTIEVIGNIYENPELLKQ